MHNQIKTFSRTGIELIYFFVDSIPDLYPMYPEHPCRVIILKQPRNPCTRRFSDVPIIQRVNVLTFQRLHPLYFGCSNVSTCERLHPLVFGCLNVPRQPDLRCYGTHREDHIADVLPQLESEFLGSLGNFVPVGTCRKSLILPLFLHRSGLQV